MRLNNVQRNAGYRDEYIYNIKTGKFYLRAQGDNYKEVTLPGNPDLPTGGGDGGDGGDNGGASYAPISLPVGMNIPIPFTIETDGTSYRVVDFDIEARANITTTQTVYVDSVAGNDGFNGESEALPFKTMTAAYNSGADCIYVKKGSYFHKNQRVNPPSRSLKVIAYGTGDNPVISASTGNQLGTFNKTGNTYLATAGDYVGKVFDKGVLDANGQPSYYEMVSDAATVDTTPGSFVWVNGEGLYIRTLDDRAPDSNLLYFDNLAHRMRADNATQYYENIEFNSSAYFMNSSATGNSKSYFSGCSLKYGGLQVHGQEESIWQDCDLNSGWGDVMNIDDRSGIAANVYEINCNMTNWYRGDTTSQGSTLHAASNAVSVNGTYTKTAGQGIGDTGTGQRYILGCTMGDTTGGVSFVTQANAFIENAEMIVDAISIRVSSTGVVRTYNNTLAGDIDIEAGGDYNVIEYVGG